MADRDELSERKEEAVPQAPRSAPKSDTSRIDLSAAEAPTRPLETGEPLTVRDVLGGTGAPPKAIPVRPPTTVLKAIPAEGPKASTSRVSLESAKIETSSLTGAAKDSTVRVDLTGVLEREGVKLPVSGGPAAPARIRVPDEPAQEAPADTAHIRLGGEVAGVPSDTGPIEGRLGEPMSDETSHIVLPGEVPGARTTAPKTIRLARPATLPKTVVLPKPAEPAPAAPPKTVTLKRPGEEAEPGKTSTARIAIPEEALPTTPSTQRRTIRIKRPEAATTGGRTVTIARPAKATAVTLSSAAEHQAEEIAKELGVEESPGVVFTALAAAAVLLAVVLLYVFAAQTIAPTLPFPGRMA